MMPINRTKGAVSKKAGSGEGMPNQIRISPKELKELKRVYSKLCFFSDKYQLTEEIRSVESKIEALKEESKKEAREQRLQHHHVGKNRLIIMNDESESNIDEYDDDYEDENEYSDNYEDNGDDDEEQNSDTDVEKHRSKHTDRVDKAKSTKRSLQSAKENVPLYHSTNTDPPTISKEKTRKKNKKKSSPSKLNDTIGSSNITPKSNSKDRNSSKKSLSFSETNVESTSSTKKKKKKKDEGLYQQQIDEFELKLSKLQKSLHQIQNKPTDKQHIRPIDAACALKRSLGMKKSKREILDMIWEVDEKLDGVIDWEEFKLMFERNIRDTSGLEPSSFYHMVQFMIYDVDDNGMVSIDETMNMVYARLGREKMEQVIGKLFGGEDGAPVREVGVQGGEIDFTRYFEVVTKEQERMFQESEMGRMLAEKNHSKL